MALFANAFLKKCIDGHDECREHPIYGSVGQNIYSGYNTKQPELNELLSGAAAKWFKESQLTYQEQIDSLYGYESIGHFTQMASELATRIGCGVALWTNSNNRYAFNVVCNYIGGNYLDEKVYVSGRKSLCTTGQNPKFTFLCSINEPQIFKDCPLRKSDDF